MQFLVNLMYAKLTFTLLTATFLQTFFANPIWNKEHVKRRWDPPFIVMNRCVPLIPPQLLRILLDSFKRVAERGKKINLNKIKRVFREFMRAY